jgi:hypothetical protein
MPSALATQLATSYKEYTEKSREQLNTSLEQRQTLQTIGPKRWEELRSRFQTTVQDLNGELNSALLQWHDIGSNLFRISKGGASFLNGIFDPDSHTLKISGPNSFDEMTYEQKVLGDDVRFVTTRLAENTPQCADEIVKNALSKLIY